MNPFRVNLIWNYISLIFLGISGITINILISIFYSSETLGAFNQVLAGYIVFAMLGSGGINFSVLSAIQSNIKDINEVKSVIAGSVIPTLFTSSFVTILYFLIIQPTEVLLNSKSVGIGMKYIMPGIFFFSINKVLIYGIINGFNRMISFSIYQSLRYILILSSLVFCLINKVQGNKLTLIFTTSELILFIFLLIDISLHIRWWDKNLVNKWVKRHLKYGLKCIIGGMLIELNTRVDIIMIGIFMSDEKVGIYSFAALFAEGFYQLLIVLQNILNPIMARQFSESKLNEFYKQFKNVKQKTYKALFFVCILSITFYPFVLNFLTNKSEFADSYIPFSILVIGITAASGYIPFYNIFSMSDMPRLQSIFMLLIFLTNLILNSIFIPILGLYGAALGTGLSFLASIYYFNYLTKNNVGLKFKK